MRSFVLITAWTLSGCSLFVGLDGLDDGDAVVGGESDSGSIDGAIKDSQVGDGQIADAGPDVVSCPSGAIFCDDFETGDFSKWESATPPTLPNLLEVSSAQRWRGKFAMHASIVDPSDSGNTFFVNAQQGFPAISSGDFAIRAYVYLPGLASDGAFFVLTHDGTQSETVILGSDLCSDNVSSCLYSATVGAVGDISGAATVPIPTAQWSCLEWVVTVGDTGHLAVYIDGAPVVQKDGNTLDPAGGYSAIDVGYLGAVGGESVFIDDIAIGTARIGCE